MKFFHEAPISVFDRVKDHTDGDYCLANVYVENDDYKNKFLESSKLGREIILDNGVFETGTAMTGDEYASIIKELQPTWYIIPDALEDCDKTINQLNNFLEKYPDLPGKKIGVVQGKTYDEIVRCYQSIKDKVDMIGVSFDYSIYEEWFPDESTKYHSWSSGRSYLLSELLNDNVIDTNKPHHLLGIGIAYEGRLHDSQYSWIYSIDTSNPVMCGIDNITYTSTGYDDKPTTKMFTIMNEDVLDKWNNIEYNINRFKTFWW